MRGIASSLLLPQEDLVLDVRVDDTVLQVHSGYPEVRLKSKRNNDQFMERTCTKCGSTYPATTEFFYKDKRYKNGLDTRCKSCFPKPSNNKELKKIGDDDFKSKFGTSYCNLHIWIRKHKQKTGVCANSSKDGHSPDYTRTEFSNISGEYKKDVDDYEELCTSCHRAKDVERRSIALENDLDFKRPNSKLTIGQVRSLREDRTRGLSYREIGEKYGVSKQTVIDMCKSLPIKFNLRNKLSDEQVRLLRDDRSQGMTYPAIGAKYGISKQHAYRICKNVNWKIV